MALATYSDAAIQDALRYVAKIVKGVPSINDYDRVREQVLLKWFNEDPKNLQDYEDPKAAERETPPREPAIFGLPSVVAIRMRFEDKGGWPAAVTFLHQEFPRDNEESDLGLLRTLVQHHKRHITEKEYDEARTEASSGAPAASTLARSYGSWKQAHEAAGVEASHHRSWSDEELVEMVAVIGVELGGRMPTVSEFDRAAEPRGWPWARQLYRKFRSWPEIARLAVPRIEEAMREGKAYQPKLPAGGEMPVRRRTRKPIDLVPLRDLGQAMGRRPHMREYQDARQGKKWPSARELKKRFESWAGACAAAGLTDGTSQNQRQTPA